jgi:hypothetical protein
MHTETYIFALAFLALLATIRMILGDISRTLMEQNRSEIRIANALEQIAERDAVKVTMDTAILRDGGMNFAGGVEEYAFSIGQQLQRGWSVG